jgi:hypothetical protein
LFKPDAEAGSGRDGKVWGAYASGVWFSASRRKLRSTNFFPPEYPGIMCVKSSGATPELARATRALPLSVSEAGLNQNGSAGQASHWSPTSQANGFVSVRLQSIYALDANSLFVNPATGATLVQRRNCPSARGFAILVPV